MKNYTDAELLELGRKAAQRAEKESVRRKEQNELVKKLLAAHKAGKIKV